MTTANSNKTLGQVFECLVQNQAICESRKGPIKSALKQYSVLLGYDDFHKCPSKPTPKMTKPGTG
jgi:hypothetical protein